MTGWLQKTWVEGFDRLFDRNLFRLDKEINEIIKLEKQSDHLLPPLRVVFYFYVLLIPSLTYKDVYIYMYI